MTARILLSLNLHKHFLTLYYNVLDYEKMCYGALKDLKVTKQ